MCNRPWGFISAAVMASLSLSRSAWMGLVRRFVDIVSLLVPQRYDVTVDGQQVGTLQRSKNPLMLKYDLSFDAEHLDKVGRNTVLSYPVILSLVEDTKQ